LAYNLWQNAWDGVIDMPAFSRSVKPRDTGLTMVMDKGLGLNETSDLLQTAGNYIDYIKLAFGTPALYNEDILRKKVALIKASDIHIYPGGTFLEIAVLQNRVQAFLTRARDIGFSAIEVSDGTVPVPARIRKQVIQEALQMGFEVLSEVGKKSPMENIQTETLINQVQSDLKAGAGRVILEARESGKGIGIYNNQGEIKQDFFKELNATLPCPDRIIWEAPLKNQQQALIIALGPNVNLGNIPPGEVLALESLRTGLRGDTLKLLIENARGITGVC